MSSLLLILGLLVLPAGIWATSRNWRYRREHPGGPASVASWLTVAAGLFLGAGCVVSPYPAGPSLKIIGVPFSAAVLLCWGDKWHDLLGFMTPILVLADFLTGFTFPQLLVVTVRWLAAGPGEKPGSVPP